MMQAVLRHLLPHPINAPMLSCTGQVGRGNAWISNHHTTTLTNHQMKVHDQNTSTQAISGAAVQCSTLLHSHIAAKASWLHAQSGQHQSHTKTLPQTSTPSNLMLGKMHVPTERHSHDAGTPHITPACNMPEGYHVTKAVVTRRRCLRCRLASRYHILGTPRAQCNTRSTEQHRCMQLPAARRPSTEASQR